MEPTASGGVLPGNDRTVNSGTLAHRALERWLKGEGYRSDNPRSSLQAVADACAAELPTGPPGDWTMARRRLIANAPRLGELVGARTPDQVSPEEWLQDDALRLRGKVDLLLTGGELVLADLKSQTLPGGEGVPERIQFQMQFYAHLVRVNYGRAPDRTVVFSLNKGVQAVDVSDATMAEALTKVAEVRSADPNVASPCPTVCRFCDRRMECDAHWSTLATWDESDVDAVKGTIVKIERAATGVSQVWLATGAGERQWVARVPTSKLSASEGDQVRFVRVSGRWGGDGAERSWMWRSWSEMALTDQ